MNDLEKYRDSLKSIYDREVINNGVPEEQLQNHANEILQLIYEKNNNEVNEIIEANLAGKNISEQIKILDNYFNENTNNLKQKGNNISLSLSNDEMPKELLSYEDSEGGFTNIILLSIALILIAILIVVIIIV